MVYITCDLEHVYLFPMDAVYSSGIPAATLFVLFPHNPRKLSIVSHDSYMKPFPDDISPGNPCNSLLIPL